MELKMFQAQSDHAIRYEITSQTTFPMHLRSFIVVVVVVIVVTKDFCAIGNAVYVFLHLVSSVRTPRVLEVKGLIDISMMLALCCSP